MPHQDDEDAAMLGTTYDIDVITAGRGEVLSFADGATIYFCGDPGDCAYIITRGRVRLGNAVMIEMLRTGEIFGELALIDHGPRDISAQAMGPTEVVAIDRALFDALVRDDPEFADTILHLLARRLRAAARALDRTSGRPRPELRVIAGG
jgi:CRP/FNR family transcriptional regulator, cyclic AMP receptor protein